MTITTEQFSMEPDVHNQEVAELVDFVNEPDTRDFLLHARPDTLQRLENTASAAQYIAHLMNANTMTGGPVRRDGQICGVYTLISSLTIQHPAQRSGSLQGDHVDYWANLDETEHPGVVGQLSQVNNIQGHRRLPRMLATLSMAEASWATGVPATMHAVGKPGPIRFPLLQLALGRDYGLTKHREPLQVYSNVPADV
jgi:hypothetical protein